MQRNRTIALTCLALVAVTIASLGAATEPTGDAKPKGFAFQDAAPSVAVLLERFLEAIERKDGRALTKLRVTEKEYRDFIMPGSAKQGLPPQFMAERDSKFFWDLLNTKSVHATEALLMHHGGKAYRLKDVRFAKGRTQYLWYEAYRAPELTLEDDAGRTVTLAVGAIADVNGSYKFVGMNEDN